MDDLIQFFISFRFLMAMLGGIGAYLMQCGYLTVGGELVQKPRVIQGLLYSFFSAVAGLCLINPPGPFNAFFVGLVGVVTMRYAFQSFRPALSSSLTETLSSTSPQTGSEDK